MTYLAYYDEIAQGYDELHKEEQLKKIAVIKKELSPGARILDVGCGPCYISSEFPNVVGIDPSIELLKKASCLKVCGKAEYLPFKYNVFDVVVCVTVIHDVSSVKSALQEMKRVGIKKWIVTVLKKSKKKEEIVLLLESLFHVSKEIDEEKDTIYIVKGEFYK